MKHKNLETYFYSTVGVIVMFVILLAFYVVTGAAKERIDLTQEKAFTLSPGTRRILAKIESPITIRFYCTQSGNLMPPALKTYAQHVEDLLDEYKQAAHGKIILQKFDPQPDSDAEDSARLDGVEGQLTSPLGGDKVYLGLFVKMLDQKVVCPWLGPDRERMLEYDVSRAIARVINTKPPVVGVMSALPVFGSEPNPMMQRMGQQGSEAAVFITELKQDFTVREVPMTASKIDDDVTVLIVDHPRDITETAQYAIDQYILRGGKVLAMVDPHAYFDQKHDQMAQVLGESSGQSSLPTLFKAWGLDMDMNKVVVDMTFAGRNPRNGGGSMPAVLLVTKEGVNTDDIVMSQIDNLVLPFAGAFIGTPTNGLKETVLIHSTKQSELVEAMTSSISGEQIVKDFKPSNTEYAMAVRLEGKFKTAFPDGEPKSAKDDKEAPKTDTNSASLKESKTDGVVILIADTDFVADQACVQVSSFAGRRFVTPMNGNLNLMQSFVELLAGDNDLISLRSRASLNRPFTRVKEMEAKASQEWEQKVKAIEEQKQQTEQKISQLQSAKQGSDSKFILSPDQQKELANYQETVAKANKDLRQTQKNLRRETDALEFHTKVANIATMPILVALTGIVLAIFKRNRTAAK